jgi:hypothetical protein
VESGKPSFLASEFPLVLGGLLGFVAEQFGATAVAAVPYLLCCPRYPCVLLTTYMLLNKYGDALVLR